MHLTVITGPMYAGKTTELLRLYRRFKKAEKNILVIKSSLDNRYDETQVTTHDQSKSEECVITDDLKKLELSIIENIITYKNKNIDVIAIDEGHFFDKDLLLFRDFLESTNTILIISGLVQQSNRDKFFKNMLKLYADADNAIKLNAICNECKKDNAIYSHRTGYNDNKQDICVDNGENMYISLCRDCKFRIG